jgi:uncharacterized protein
MSPTLPELIDVQRAADSGTELAGRVPLAALPRLREVLLDPQGEAEYRLEFSRDEARRAVVLGEVRASLTLRCERCLGPMHHQVASEVSLALVSGLDEAERLPDRYDPLLLGDSRQRPLELIEDELLLALPQIPLHGGDECSAQAPEATPESAPQSPFAVLEAWRRKR